MQSPESNLLTVIPAELEKAVTETGLALDSAQTLRESFAPHFIKFHELAIAAKEIAVNAPKAAREMRLSLRAVRVAAEKTRKELNEDGLRRTKAINGINAILEYQLAPIELAMDKIEKAEEIAAAQRKAALKEEREAALAPYMQNAGLVMVADMAPEAFAQFLASQKAAHEARIAAEAKAEADRIAAAEAAEAARKAKEEADRAERERMRAENERLAAAAKAEREAREAAEKAAKVEQERQHAQAKKEREEIERKNREEQASREEAARKERARLQAIADDERKKREAVEAEQRQKAQEEAARIAAEKAAAKKAAAAPDKEKLRALYFQVCEIKLPELATKEGNAIRANVENQLKELTWSLKTAAEKL